MAKVDPYHTVTNELSYGQRNVYHDQSECPDGQRIEANNWRWGRGDRSRCDECKKLD